MDPLDRLDALAQDIDQHRNGDSDPLATAGMYLGSLMTAGCLLMAGFSGSPSQDFRAEHLALDTTGTNTLNLVVAKPQDQSSGSSLKWEMGAIAGGLVFVGSAAVKLGDTSKRYA